MPGSVVWVTLDPTVGREQSGRRPAVVVSSRDYLDVVDQLAVVVPVTRVNRGWPNHIRLDGSDLPAESWAMTEQLRTVARDRIAGSAGQVSASTLAEIRLWIADFLDLAPA
ncbi:type II toxin-antitoxin system PemK/MazF family toxin [Gordonia sp. (in: high G+C Gram-positive bacteria)]|uniref:type II toxin-antitoxin system PemK/MazF family toxin n=1 Tax=Gordonia sp. (in: high G+C Gram-positive bacteria) TaxID=84139 RepID=UPI0039E611BC